MSKYINLIASIQENLKVAINQLYNDGNEDLSILLGICYNKLNDDCDKDLIKQAIKDIHLEANNRAQSKELVQKARMSLCPKCKRVKNEAENCPSCAPEEVKPKEDSEVTK